MYLMYKGSSFVRLSVRIEGRGRIRRWKGRRGVSLKLSNNSLFVSLCVSVFLRFTAFCFSVSVPCSYLFCLSSSVSDDALLSASESFFLNLN